MPTPLTITVSDETYAQLVAEAARNHRTIEQVAQDRLAEKAGDSDTGPLTCPRPLIPVRVVAGVGQERLPAQPVILTPTPE